MTFKHFEEIVKIKYPNAKLWAHGVMSGNKINVSIAFNSTGKVYSYSGTYVYVLNKLGIKTIYKSDVKSKESLLKRLESENGTWKSNIFLPNEQPKLIDNSNEINILKSELVDIYNNYEIV